MLVPILEKVEKVNEKLVESFYKHPEHYKYYFCSGYLDLLKPATDTWEAERFASVNPEGEVIGFISISHERRVESAKLVCINFTSHPVAENRHDNAMIFTADLETLLTGVIQRVRVLRFGVAIGNPAEKGYDLLCQRFGGRVVGTETAIFKLSDGTVCDFKGYEVPGQLRR